MRLAVAAVVMFVLIGGCVGRPEPDATGEEIYLQVCSNCHGANLEGRIGPPLGPGSNAAGHPDEFLAFTIIQGRGRMPSFASTLDDPQLDRLIAYLRVMQDE